MYIPDNTPVLVGAGQATNRLPPEKSPTPLDMMIAVAHLAAEDAEAGTAAWKHLDTIAATRPALDSTEFGNFGVGRYSNLPRTLANALRASARHEFYAAAGGDTPQMLISAMAERIAAGQSDVVLIAGSENLNTFIKASRSGVELRWSDDPGGIPEVLGSTRAGTNTHENEHGLFYPINTFPLFEHAIRGQAGRTIPDHLLHMARLFAPFSEVASKNPHAWFPQARTVAEIATPTPKNRYVGLPYTKYLNAMIQVDMAAAVLMMSAGTAHRLGIPRRKWVFIHGHAHACDHWHFTERNSLYASPGMQRAANAALAVANTSITNIDYFDLYSCFPAAVEIACASLGIAEDDPRPFTVTGGLPYFGGPGNNYVLHAVATMMDTLRAHPGSSGMLNGVGWYLTKHAFGIYSSTPPESAARSPNTAQVQAELDALPKAPFTETPAGKGTIETYTITFNHHGPDAGIVVGRLANGVRFLANFPAEPALLEQLAQVDCLGMEGSVYRVGSTNIFRPG